MKNNLISLCKKTFARHDPNANVNKGRDKRLVALLIVLHDVSYLIEQTAQRPLKVSLFLIGWSFLTPSAYGAMFKCVDPSGRITFQDSPCAADSSESSVKLPALPSSVPRASGERAPNNIDVKGPLEVWERFTGALRRGDKNAAMRELTPSAQEKYGPIFDELKDNGNKK